MSEIIGVGWDVGGWRGAKQAVAVIRQDHQQREWAGRPRTFTIEALMHAGGTLLDLIRLGWPDAPDDLLDQQRVILAIDAPLGFPVAFQQIIARTPSVTIEPGPEINNPFAYREAERWVYRTFGKKALSASFDKMGNNATVAMYHAERWAIASAIPIVPFRSDAGQHAIFEVYPALVKDRKTAACLQRIKPYLPSDLPDRSDELDAAICALHALAYALNGRDCDLPALVGPPAALDAATVAAEGWIYHFPPSWLSLNGVDQIVSEPLTCRDRG